MHGVVLLTVGCKTDGVVLFQSLRDVITNLLIATFKAAKDAITTDGELQRSARF